MGWGKITVTQYGFIDGGICISIKFNPFIEECKSKTANGCIFLRGIISGITSEIHEEEIQFSNPQCQKTDDKTCLLHLRATMR